MIPEPILDGAARAVQRVVLYGTASVFIFVGVPVLMLLAVVMLLVAGCFVLAREMIS